MQWNLNRKSYHTIIIKMTLLSELKVIFAISNICRPNFLKKETRVSWDVIAS